MLIPGSSTLVSTDTVVPPILSAGQVVRHTPMEVVVDLLRRLILCTLEDRSPYSKTFKC